MIPDGVLHTIPITAVTLALIMLSVTRLPLLITVYAVQTGLLGAFAIIRGMQKPETALFAAGVAVFLIKGVFLPLYLSRMAKRVGCRKDSSVLISPGVLLLLLSSGVAILILILVPVMKDVIPENTLPGFAILLASLVFMITRRTALAQVLGFLSLENGVFLYSISQHHSMPLVIEIGALLDILAGSMVAGILILRIKDRFANVDVTTLQELRG